MPGIVGLFMSHAPPGSRAGVNSDVDTWAGGSLTEYVRQVFVRLSGGQVRYRKQGSIGPTLSAQRDH
jgi:hypothetical protein